MIIEDFGLHSNDHFESHLLGNGLSQDDSNCETNHPNKILSSLNFLTCACCNSTGMKKINHYEQIHAIWRRNQRLDLPLYNKWKEIMKHENNQNVIQQIFCIKQR